MARALFLVLLVAMPAEAGILSLLSKLGRGGRAASSASRVSRVARVSKLAAGATSVVVAERATVALVGLGADAAHAGYLARGAGGELMLATSTSRAPQVIDDVGRAVGGLAEPGLKPTVVLDPSVAATPEVLHGLPADTRVVLAKGRERVPVQRVHHPDGTSSFEVGDGLDLAEYATDLIDVDDEGETEQMPPGVVFAVALVMFGAIAWKMRG